MTNKLAKIIKKLRLSDQEVISFCHMLEILKINKAQELLSLYSQDELQVAFLLAISRRLDIFLSFNDVCELVRILKHRERTIRRFFQSKVAFEIKPRMKERRKIGRPKSGKWFSRAGRPELEYKLLPWYLLLNREKIAKFKQFLRGLGYDKKIKSMDRSLIIQSKGILTSLKNSVNAANHKSKEIIIKTIDSYIKKIDRNLR